MSVKQFIGSEYVTHIEQIHPPQPAESPDDWVTQDVELPRNGVDHWCWIRLGKAPARYDWRNGNGHFDRYRHGDTDQSGYRQLHVRCRRRDYPQTHVEVHTGEPLVARSEYERVCGERDEGWFQAARIRDEAVKLAAERDQLKADQESLLNQLNVLDTAKHAITMERDVAESRLERNVDDNGWPLVPVDPSCIPDGHRAVEVTRATAGKLVASSDGNARHFNGTHIVPRLVVEPIPTPAAPDTLPRPEFPAWIRAGWWVAMDSGGFWYMSEDEPIATEPVLGSTAGRGTWNPPNMDDIQLTHGVTASMKAVPCDRWREAKWQVE